MTTKEFNIGDEVFSEICGSATVTKKFVNANFFTNKDVLTSPGGIIYEIQEIIWERQNGSKYLVYAEELQEPDGNDL